QALTARALRTRRGEDGDLLLLEGPPPFASFAAILEAGAADGADDLALDVGALDLARLELRGAAGALPDALLGLARRLLLPRARSGVGVDADRAEDVAARA